MKGRGQVVFIAKRIVSLCAVVGVSGVLLLQGRSEAQIITMVDGGSSAALNLDSSAGMYNWTVGGQNQLNQQWFWYRIGSTGVAAPINSIPLYGYSTYLGPDGINEVVATYQNATLTLTIDYLLSGGGVGSGSADITESISAVNNTGASLDFHFFQYSDFNLLGDGSSDIVDLFGTPGSWNFVQQTAGSSGIGEAIVAPDANHGEAAYAGTTLAELNGTSGLTLNDNPHAGPGDVTWALQWDSTIPVGGIFDLTKDKSLFIQVVPEPSTMALIALGLGAWGWARRRQRS